MSAYRKYVLPEGTVLHGASHDYTIVSVLSAGGSSVTYQAKSHGIYYCIKECYPLSIDKNIQREETGIAFTDSLSVPAEQARATYAKYYTLFEKESDRMQRLGTCDNNNDYAFLLLMDSFCDKGFYYNVYQTAKNRTLKDFFSDNKNAHLSMKQVIFYLSVFRKLLLLLDTLHTEKKMLHLDIAPDNILIIKEQQQTVRIIDYASALENYETLTEAEKKEFVYSKKTGYSALELCEYANGNREYIDRLIPATDLYSVGACMFECFVGRRIESTDLVLSDWKKELSSRCDLPDCIAQKLIRLIEKNVSSDITKRHSSAAEFAGEIVEIDNAMIRFPAQESHAKELKKTKHRFYVRISVIVFVFLIALFGILSAGNVYHCYKKIDSILANDNQPVADTIGSLQQIEKTIPEIYAPLKKHVYKTIADSADYSVGMCLKKDYLSTDIIQSAAFINTQETMLALQHGKNYFSVIDIKNPAVTYTITHQQLCYTEESNTYQIIFATQDMTNPVIDQILFDDNTTTFYIALSAAEDSLFVSHCLQTHTTGYLPFLPEIHISHDALSSNYVVSIDNLALHLTYLPANHAFSLLHSAPVVLYAFSSDERTLWSLDADGTCYTWALQDGFSPKSILADCNSPHIFWVITHDGLVYKADRKTDTYTALFSRPVFFFGQTSAELFFVAYINDGTPVLYRLDKNTHVLSQAKAFPQDLIYAPSFEQPHVYNLSPKESLFLSQMALFFIKKESYPETFCSAWEQNHSLQPSFSDADSPLPSIQMKLNDKCGNLHQTIYLSDATTPLFRLLYPAGITQCIYYFDGNRTTEYRSDWMALSSVSVKPLFPPKYKDGALHTLHLSVTAATGISFSVSVPFVYSLEDTSLHPTLNVSAEGRFLVMDRLSFIESPVIDIQVQSAFPVIKTEYAFDLDEKIFQMTSDTGSITIPDRYLDKKEHVLYICFASKTNQQILYSEWYAFPFIYTPPAS